jgi:tRNA(fMet)-specific endonuclease VapC
MVCLDTNVVIAYLARKQTDLIDRLQREILVRAVSISVVTLFELQYGIAKSERQLSNAARLDDFLSLQIEIWPFEVEDAEEAGQIRASLERAGSPIGPYDVLIAAQARRRGVLLVTANQREFARVPGLRTEDWAAG